MSYRKIEVDGQVFEYSIGRTHTKIRHVGAYKNEDVGRLSVNKLHDWYDTSYQDFSFQVRPRDLAEFIKRNKFRST